MYQTHFPIKILIILFDKKLRQQLEKMLPQREQRPMQSSMILPDNNNTLNKRLSGQIQYNFPVPNIKKMQNFLNQDGHQFQHHNVVLQQGTRQQFQTHLPLEQVNQHRANDPILAEIYEKLEKIGRVVDKHEFQLSSLSIEGEFSKRVLNQVKRNLPVFTGGNDVYEHILGLKLQIKNMQEEMNKIPKMVEIEQIVKRETQSVSKKLDGGSSSNLTASTSSNKTIEAEPMIQEMFRKRDEVIQNLLSNLETQISIVKKTIGNMNLEMKVSPIVSNSCIMLKYQQLFKARNKNQSDMVLSENTYYIDNQGYLLDCHSRYIVDQKGKKIKLEDKHIILLKSQKILQ